MKLGRMMYYDKIQVPFEDEINRINRTQTSPKRVVKIDIKVTFLLISQKVRDRILKNFISRCAIVIYILLVNFRLIGSVEHKPCPKEMLNSTYLCITQNVLGRNL